MNNFSEKTIIIPAGTEINNGPSEDSDSVVLEKPFEAEIVGEETEGAIPIRIFGEVRYFHQPPKTKT